ncbi:MAG: hypothetical protein ACJ741_05515, partial [Pyrinomonadaceae bacterium]
MMTRRFITTLLIIVLTLSCATRALASPRAEDLAITPDEEREARELLEEFNNKFVETNDIAPLIKEYFVPDFASRLGQHAETFPFQLIEWKDESAPPDADDLLRFYVASTNCLHTLIPIYYAASERAKKDRGEDSDEEEPELEEVLPPAAVELIKSDPLLRGIFEDKDGETTPKSDDGAQASLDSATRAENPDDPAKGDEQRENEREDKVDNAEKLRRVTSVLEGVS